MAYEPQGGRDPLLRDDLIYTVLAAGTGVNTNSLKFDVCHVGRAVELGLPLRPRRREPQASASGASRSR